MTLTSNRPQKVHNSKNNKYFEQLIHSTTTDITQKHRSSHKNTKMETTTKPILTLKISTASLTRVLGNANSH